MPDQSVHQEVLAILQCETGRTCGCRGFGDLGELHDQAPEKTQEVYGMLGHHSWRLRLEACQALIDQKTADARVVATLEAMSRDPEAAVYDAEMDKTKEFAGELVKVLCPDGTLLPTWDKLNTILNKARAIAAGDV